jgi:hypothetical protein
VGIRETIGKKKSLTVVGAVVVLVGSIVAIIVQARSFGPGGPGDSYFTVDDGKTFFVGDSKKLPPFDEGGKQAVRAHVFECGGKRVVGYVSRYTADALATIEEAKQARAAGRLPANVGKLATVAQNGTEIKRPGDTKWVIGNVNTAAQKIRIFKCPDGSAPPEVFP